MAWNPARDFMEGLAFAHSIADANRRREREDTLWERQDEAYEREQLQREAEQLSRFRQAYGDRLRSNDPQAVQALDRLIKTSPRIASLLELDPGPGTGRYRRRVTGVRVGPGGLVAEVSHIDPDTGEVVSVGPETVNGSSADEDVVVPRQGAEFELGLDELDARLAALLPSHLEYTNQQAARRWQQGLFRAAAGPVGVPAATGVPAEAGAPAPAPAPVEALPSVRMAGIPAYPMVEVGTDEVDPRLQASTAAPAAPAEAQAPAETALAQAEARRAAILEEIEKRRARYLPGLESAAAQGLTDNVRRLSEGFQAETAGLQQALAETEAEIAQLQQPPSVLDRARGFLSDLTPYSAGQGLRRAMTAGADMLSRVHPLTAGWRAMDTTPGAVAERLVGAGGEFIAGLTGAPETPAAPETLPAPTAVAATQPGLQPVAQAQPSSGAQPVSQAQPSPGVQPVAQPAVTPREQNQVRAQGRLTARQQPQSEDLVAALEEGVGAGYISAADAIKLMREMRGGKVKEWLADKEKGIYVGVDDHGNVVRTLNMGQLAGRAGVPGAGAADSKAVMDYARKVDARVNDWLERHISDKASTGERSWFAGELAIAAQRGLLPLDSPYADGIISVALNKIDSARRRRILPDRPRTGYSLPAAINAAGLNMEYDDAQRYVTQRFDQILQQQFGATSAGHTDHLAQVVAGLVARGEDAQAAIERVAAELQRNPQGVFQASPGVIATALGGRQ